MALGFGFSNGDRVQGRDVGRGRVLHGSRVRVLVVRSRGRVLVWPWGSGSIVEIEFGIGGVFEDVFWTSAIWDAVAYQEACLGLK